MKSYLHTGRKVIPLLLVAAMLLTGNKVWSQAPPNDECSGAIELFPEVSCNYVPGSLTNATLSIGPPTGSNPKDVWYKLTATDTVLEIKTTHPTSEIIYISVYSGECDDLTMLPVFGYDTLVLHDLIIGNQYYFRIATINGLDTFNICLIGLNNVLSTVACWKEISVGQFHSVAIRDNGTLWAWGQNTNGQLGDGTNINKSYPIQIGEDNDWKVVSAGGYHTVAIKEDGTLWAWGANNFGQLAILGGSITRYSPVKVDTMHNWKFVSCGTYHSIALKTDSTLWVWGYNNYGQLGDGTNTQKNTPTQILNTTPWKIVRAGGSHTVAIKYDSTLWTWGENIFGGLGDGTTSSKNIPVHISPSNYWIDVSAGASHTLAIKSDSTLWGWGYNGYGGVGDGTTINRKLPVLIDVSRNWKSIFAKASFSIGTKLDGTLWGWGRNDVGSLGNGTTTTLLLPEQISGLTDWHMIASGVSGHNIASRAGGSLWAWGHNSAGQVGDSTNTNRNIPISISNSCTPTTCPTWTDVPPTDTLILNATNYLCSLGIIQNTQSSAWNQLPIRRHDLAKIVFLGLLGTDTITPAERFPTPFYDLQDTSAYYYRYAKALSYLEYGDGISPFTRSFAHFRPSDSITRKDAMKVFAEAWNLSRAALGSGTSPFSDITNSDYAYQWIKTLSDSGIVYGSGGLFNPSGSSTEKLTRNDAFIILYRLLTKLTKPTVNDTDYYQPHLITEYNLSMLPGLDGGAFNSYAQSSFNISGLTPLNFGQTYSSAAADLPEEFYKRSTTLYGNVYTQQALSPGWTHTYNAYIVPIFGDSASTNVDDRLLVHWPDGTIHFYRLPVSPGAPYICESYGVYDSLYVGGSGYEIRKKSGTVFKFNPHFVALGVSFIAPLAAVTDAHNNTLSLTYDTIGNVPALHRVIDQMGRYLEFSYTNTSFPHQITGVSAVTGGITRNVSFTYNSKGLLTSYTDPKGESYQYTYGTGFWDDGLLTKITLPKGNEINNIYQHRKLTASNMNDVYEQTVDLSLDYSEAQPKQSSSMTTMRAGTELTQSVRRDHFGNLLSLTGTGMKYSAAYTDPVNPKKPTTIVDSLGGVTVSTNYDAFGNLLNISKTAGATTLSESYTYNTNNDVTSHTDANGNTTSYMYSGVNLTSVNAPIGTTAFSYNPDGTVSSTTNPSGIVTEYEYNTYGNLISTTTAGFFTSTANYDDAGRLITATDAKGVSSTFSYDNNNNMLSEHFDPAVMDILTTFGFDNNNNMTSVTNALGNATTMTYNDQDALVSKSFGGKTTAYAYNDDGSLQSTTTPNGAVLGNTYDADGRIINDGYATYTYNTDNTLATLTHNGKTLTYGYDIFKRVIWIAYSDFTNDTVSYQYDNNGNITQIRYPAGAFTANYTYDANNRMTAVSDGSSTLVSYTYLADGRLSEENLGNGTKVKYFYDAAGRLDSLANVRSDGSVIAAYGYSKDALGNHLEERADIPGGLTLPTLPDVTFSGSYSFNKINTYNGSSYTYDNNGNHTADGGTVTYSWDDKDNLLSYNSATLTATYEYDGTEARRKRNSTLYVLDPLHSNSVLMETNLSGTPSAIYVHGLGLVCRVTPGSGAKDYYHYDYRGSTVAITNAAQAVTHRYRYGAFGEQYGVQESGFNNAFRYVGKYGVMYEDSLLYFMRARYYNPELGRFLGEDPVWATNLFAYCENNPVNKIDINGETPDNPINHFSPYAWQCTWGVQNFKNGTDWKGDAAAWVDNAEKAGYEISADPQIGDIVVFSATKYNGKYGHVGVIVGFDEDNTPLYIATNEDGKDSETRRVDIKRIDTYTKQSKGRVLGYIHYRNNTFNDDFIKYNKVDFRIDENIQSNKIKISLKMWYLRLKPKLAQ